MTTPSLLGRVAAAGLKPLRMGDRELLPIVQGGMGVGVSAHRLAGSVASQGAWGTIASVDLRRHHPDLMARSQHLRDDSAEKKAVIEQANQEALVREIRQAREIAGGRGVLAVNVMRAVSDYAASVRTALQEGVDALVVGAGLPLDLPELAQDHPGTALVPILSDARGVALLWRKWERRQRIPSAIVIEHPAHAAGHLGAAKVADLGDARFEFETVLLAQARDEDLVEFTSVAGLPARAVMTPWLNKYLKAEERLQAVVQLKQRCTMAFDCLSQCGLRDGLKGWGQFCIDQRLAAALRGETAKGLFFRGRGALPFGSQITSVRQLLERLLTPGVPLGTPA